MGKKAMIRAAAAVLGSIQLLGATAVFAQASPSAYTYGTRYDVANRYCQTNVAPVERHC